VDVRDEVRQLAGPLAEESGYELVDVELGAQGHLRIVRVLLDKPGGITIGDCSAFSRRLADCLDMNQTIHGSYRLEVSSPGMDRPIRTLEAVERFAGSRVRLESLEAHEGRRNWDGVLIGRSGPRAGLRTDAGEERWFEWHDVKSVRLSVDPWEAVRRRTAEREGESR
jgi:ribosome maturation factor RimP